MSNINTSRSRLPFQLTQDFKVPWEAFVRTKVKTGISGVTAVKDVHVWLTGLTLHRRPGDRKGNAATGNRGLIPIDTTLSDKPTSSPLTSKHLRSQSCLRSSPKQW